MFKSIVLASAVSFAAMSAVSASEATLAADISAAQSQLWSDLASADGQLDKVKARRDFHKARAAAFSTELDLAKIELQARQDAQVAANIKIFEQQVEINELAASLTEADVVIANLVAARSDLIAERNDLALELWTQINANADLQTQHASDIAALNAEIDALGTSHDEAIATLVAQHDIDVAAIVAGNDVVVAALNEEIHSLEGQLVIAFDDAASDLAEAGLYTGAVYDASIATVSKGSGAGYFTELSNSTSHYSTASIAKASVSFTTKTGETITENANEFLFGTSSDDVLAFAEAQRIATVRAVQDLSQAVYAAGEASIRAEVQAISTDSVSNKSNVLDQTVGWNHVGFDNGTIIVHSDASATGLDVQEDKVIYTTSFEVQGTVGNNLLVKSNDIAFAVQDAYKTGYDDGYNHGFKDGFKAGVESVKNTIGN